MEQTEHLADRIQKEIASFPGKVQLLYREYGKAAEGLCLGAEEPVVSASTIKVPILMGLLDKAKSESISLQTPVPVRERDILPDSKVFEYGSRRSSLYELAVWMIVNSDNTSTNVLISYLGMDWLNSYFQNVGLSCTRLERYMLDFDAVAHGKNNYISPADFCRCLERWKEAESEDPYSSLALSILRRNRDWDALCRYLYEDLSIPHKTGGLDGIEHDAGFIERKGDYYFLGIFVSEFEPSEAMSLEAQKLMGRVSRMIFDERGTQNGETGVGNRSQRLSV